MTSTFKYEEEATGLSLMRTREVTVVFPALIYEKNCTGFSTLCWEGEGKSNSKKATQHTQVFFLHTIAHNSIKQELEGVVSYYAWTSEM